jgi:hypothetical protein
MAEAAATDTIAAELTEPEPVLLFCLASDNRLGEGCTTLKIRTMKY